MNKTLLQGFSWYIRADGGHWRRAESRADDLVDLGITSVWLPPAYKGAQGMHDVGYGVYDLYDLGEFDQKGSVPTKYGTKEEFLSCVSAFHGRGIRVLLDVVLNQRMGADEREHMRARMMDFNDRNRAVSDLHDIEAWTKFTFPGRKGRYSDFVWDWNCFHGVDFNAATGQNAIYLFEGKHWDERVTKEFGNFDYLMGCDVDLNYAPVYEELVRWGVWFVNLTGADGLRLDAIKHMDRSFYLRWLNDVQDAVGRRLYVVGEYWESELDALRGYLGHERAMSLFDVHLHFKLHEASLANGDFDLRTLFDETLVQADPHRAVTFVDNHDTQHGQSLQSSIDFWFKPIAYALILLRQEGLPCVFYGDLFGTPRVDAVPSLPTIVKVRRLLAYGQQRDWFDDPDCIGWTREGDARHAGSGCAVVFSDKSENQKHMFVGLSHVREMWRCVVGRQPDVLVDAHGWATFNVAGGGVSVYVSHRGASRL